MGLAACVVVAAALPTFVLPVVQQFGVVQWEDPLFTAQIAKFHSLREALTAPQVWQGLYRPVSANLYYYVGERVVGGGVAAAHFYGVVNVLVFLLNALLVFALARRYVSLGAALVVGALFASRNAATETLIAASQMQTLLPATFGLAMLLALTRSPGSNQRTSPFLAGICLLLALLSKESALSLVPVWWMAVYLEGPRRGAWRSQLLTYLLPCSIAVAWAALVRHQLDLVRWSYETRLGVLAGHYVEYAAAFLNGATSPIVVPVYPCLMMDAFPVITWLRDNHLARLLIVLTVVAAFIGALALRHVQSVIAAPRARAWAGLALGIALFAFTLTPTAILKDRELLYYAYLPHLGLSLASGAFVSLVFVPLLRRVSSSRHHSPREFATHWRANPSAMNESARSSAGVGRST